MNRTYVVKSLYDVEDIDAEPEIVYAGPDAEEAFTMECDRGEKLTMQVWEEKQCIAELYLYGDLWYPENGKYVDDIEFELKEINKEIDKLVSKVAKLDILRTKRERLFEERAIERNNPNLEIFDEEDEDEDE